MNRLTRLLGTAVLTITLWESATAKAKEVQPLGSIELPSGSYTTFHAPKGAAYQDAVRAICGMLGKGGTDAARQCMSATFALPDGQRLTREGHLVIAVSYEATATKRIETQPIALAASQTATQLGRVPPLPNNRLPSRKPEAEATSATVAQPTEEPTAVSGTEETQIATLPPQPRSVSIPFAPDVAVIENQFTGETSEAAYDLQLIPPPDTGTEAEKNLSAKRADTPEDVSVYERVVDFIYGIIEKHMGGRWEVRDWGIAGFVFTLALLAVMVWLIVASILLIYIGWERWATPRPNITRSALDTLQRVTEAPAKEPSPLRPKANMESGGEAETVSEKKEPPGYKQSAPAWRGLPKMQVVVFSTMSRAGTSHNLELWVLAELDCPDGSKWRLLGHPASSYGVYYRNGKSKARMHTPHVHVHIEKLLHDLHERHVPVGPLVIDDHAFGQAVAKREQLTILNPEDDPLQKMASRQPSTSAAPAEQLATSSKPEVKVEEKSTLGEIKSLTPITWRVWFGLKPFRGDYGYGRYIDLPKTKQTDKKGFPKIRVPCGKVLTITGALPHMVSCPHCKEKITNEKGWVFA